MLARNALAILALCFATGCDRFKYAGETLNVEDVISRINELDGQTVIVRGLVGYCEGYICQLNSMTGKPNENGEIPSLSIGQSEKFDSKLVGIQRAEIVFKAKVNSECFPANCTDRADILQPIEIVSLKEISRAFSAKGE